MLQPVDVPRAILRQERKRLFSNNFCLKDAHLKLPSRLFLDFKPGGSLCYIFLVCLKFRHEQGWRKLDFGSPRVEKFVEMFETIKRELAHQHLWSRPCIFVPSIDDVRFISQYCLKFVVF